MTARIPTPEERRQLDRMVNDGVFLRDPTSGWVHLSGKEAGAAEKLIPGLLAAADERDRLAGRLDVAESALAALRERVTWVAKTMRSRDEFEPGPFTSTSFIEIWAAELLDICGEPEGES